MERTGIRALIRRALPRRIKPHRILGGRLKGKRLVTSWYDYPAAILGYTEEQLLAWFATHVKPGESWLDVGAHYGYTALALAELVGPRGHVWAFEPVPATAGHLIQTARLNGVAHLTVLPLALGTPEAVRLDRLAAVRGMAENSLPTGDFSSAIMVTRLDWLWPRVCGSSARIDGVKIDVQGMELEVLRGMHDILKAQRPVVIVELHHGVDRHEILDTLGAAGYHGNGHPIELEPDGEPQYADDRSYVFLPDGS
jgi:FkbM family methyltransferase